MVERAGIEAKLGFKAHPHMLRHACGFALANKGHDTRALQLLVTAISSTLCAIPSCHPIGSKTFGGKGL
jgi:site-specific recombinase XerD